MAYVNTVVYKVSFDVYPTGCPTSVSTDSQILLVENVPLYDIPQACNPDPQEYKTLLKINEPNKGIMWIDETIVSFEDKIAAASSSTTGGAGYINSTIGNAGQPPAGLTVTYTVLIGATLQQLSVRGQLVDPTGRLNNITGAIDLTDIGGVANGDLVTAQYTYP